MPPFVAKELKETADVSRGKFSFKNVIRTALSALVILALIYVALGFTADLTAKYISDKHEAEIFGGMTDAIGDDHAVPERVSKVFAKLLDKTPLRSLHYRLFSIEEKLPNAFALPGGAIGVTTGLVDAVKSDQGLAFVLAHELGHHQERHALKRLGRGLLYTLFLAVIETGGAPSSGLLDASQYLMTANYSRRQEEDADAFALALLKTKYGDLHGALEFFEWVLCESDRNESRIGELFSTHPLTADRINDLRQTMGLKPTSADTLCPAS